MRSGIICVLISILVNGCNPMEQAAREAERQQAVEDNLKQINDELHQAAAAAKNKSTPQAASTWTHTITSETDYYTTGPQQARPADGRFPADTKARIVKPAGSYTLIETSEGQQAYVASDALKPL